MFIQKPWGRASVRVWALLSFLWSGAAAAQAPAANLSVTSVAAKGRGESLLTVTRFGRYAISANSKQGTAIQLISRMQGPGEIHGERGKQNGRIDAILDRGSYKVVTWSHAKGNGKATLQVQAFKELNTTPTLLVTEKLVSAELRDFEQRSYWLEVTDAQTVLVEAAGRALRDLRLWKDGEWLVDAEPLLTETQPEMGRPLTNAQLTTHLEPGLYLVTAYGGPNLPWADENHAQPFHLRLGIPTLGSVGRTHYEVGPMGVDRYLVPGDATYFRIELPEAKPVTLNVQGSALEPTYFGGKGVSVSVAKNSVPPVAEVVVGQAAAHLVTVSAPAGQPYVLQHFSARRYVPLRPRDFNADVWIGSQHSGAAGDAIDATGVVVCGRGNRAKEVRAASVVTLDAEHSYRRRFNLLETANLFVEVKEAGNYRVDFAGDGVKANYRFEPLILSPSARYEPPPNAGSGSSTALGVGFYNLTISPEQKGIVEMTVRRQSAMNTLTSRVDNVAETPVRAAVTFPEFHLTDDDCDLTINSQPGVVAGLELRSLPVNLTQALAVTQLPGAELSVPITVLEPGIVRAQMERGPALSIQVDGQASTTEVRVAAGNHRVVVPADPKRSLQYALVFEPTRLSHAAPLPSLPDTAKALIPKLEILAQDSPRFFNLKRQGERSFLVRVAKPGLYRLESTGLLATFGNLRTRTLTRFDAQEQNGVGRNFLIQQYLREGDYLLTVAARGETRGHLGVTLAETPIADGGELQDGLVARARQHAYEATLYRFKVKPAGSYQLKAFGMGRSFRGRLEDGEGWPLEPPGQNAEFNAWFAAGNYRLMVLPESVDALQLTRLTRAKKAKRLRGHGPHELAPGQCPRNTWLEPAEGGERKPDVWRFVLPAAATTAITLSDDMVGKVFMLNDKGERAALGMVSKNVAFDQALMPGRYELEMVHARLNNRVPYRVCVRPQELVANTSRELKVPSAPLWISVAQPSLVELASFGTADVRGSLWSDAGQLLMRSDDRDDDWNFHLASFLTPGRYRLEVEAVGQASASTTVEMRVPAEVVQSGLSLPASFTAQPGNDVWVYPLPALAADAELLAVQANAREGMGISLERAVAAGRFEAMGTDVGRRPHLEVPTTAKGTYRLKVWSTDRRGTPLGLQVAAIKVPAGDEGDLRKGLALPAIPGFAPELAASVVSLEAPGQFGVVGDTEGLRVSCRREQAARAVIDARISGCDTRIFLTRPGKAAEVQATRLRLEPWGTAAPMTVTPGEQAQIDVEAAPGPLVVVVTARRGQPGLSLHAERETRLPAGAVSAPWVRGAVAVAVNSRKPWAEVWAATPIGEPLDVKLQAYAFAAPSADGRSPQLTGRLNTREARAVTLPSGTKRLELVADPGTIAVLLRGDATLSVHGNPDEPLNESIDTAAERLLWLRVGEGEGAFAAQLVPLAKGSEIPSLALGVAFERQLAAAGVQRLDVAPDSGGERLLTVLGADGDVTFVSTDGNVVRGQTLVLPAQGGVAYLPHRPGWLLAYVQRGEERAAGIWGALGDARSRTVRAPERLALSGVREAFKLEAREPIVFHLRGVEPVAVRIKRPDGHVEAAVYPSGVALDLYAASGTTEVTVRGLGGRPLTGSLDITTSTVATIGEGVGPELLLGPGEARFFAFDVRQAGKVGVGVRSDSDRVETELQDATGTFIGKGIAQMPELKIGHYLLVLRLARDATPARLRPAIVGLVPPDIGPPDEVKRQYVEVPGAGSVEFTAQRAQPGYGFGRGLSTVDTVAEGEVGADAGDLGQEQEMEEQRGGVDFDGDAEVSNDAE